MSATQTQQTAATYLGLAEYRSGVRRLYGGAWKKSRRRIRQAIAAGSGFAAAMEA